LKEYYTDPYFNQPNQPNQIETFKNPPTGLNKIPRILVISSGSGSESNSKENNERWNKFKKILQNHRVNLDQVTRIMHEPSKEKPYTKCSKAYLTAFRHAQDKNYDSVLILEDDFVFKLNPDQVIYVINSFLQKVPKKDWDIVFLSQRNGILTETKYPFLDRIKHTLTGGAFLVNKNYYSTMIELAKQSLRGLKGTGDKKFAIDEIWKPNQIRDNWFTFNPLLGQSTTQICRLSETNPINVTVPSPNPGQATERPFEMKGQPTPPPATSGELKKELDQYRKESEKQKESETKALDQWRSQIGEIKPGQIKHKLDLSGRLDQDDVELKKVLEEIAKGSFKGNRYVKPPMKIPSTTLHPNPKCRKYYQLPQKS